MNTTKDTVTDHAVMRAEPAQTVRGILIDPATDTVKQVEYNGKLEHLYQLIGCRCVDLAQLQNGDVVWVDDEGLFSNSFGFLIEGLTLAGKGLVLGTGKDGESTHAKHSVQDVRAKTRMGTLRQR